MNVIPKQGYRSGIEAAPRVAVVFLAGVLWSGLLLAATSSVPPAWLGGRPHAFPAGLGASIDTAETPPDFSRSQAGPDTEAQCELDFSDHWARYQRLADRSMPESLSKPDFSGHWVLNPEASDDPIEKAKEAIQASRQAMDGARGRGPGGGMGGGKGRGGGMAGGRQDRGGIGGMAASGGPSSAELSALLSPSQELHITHEDPMLLIADEYDRRQRLFTDFRGASVSANGGLQQRVAVAGWEGAALVVEAMMLGKKLAQSYQIDSGTGQLVISSVAQVSVAPPVSYRLVYDRMTYEPRQIAPAGGEETQ